VIVGLGMAGRHILSGMFGVGGGFPHHRPLLIFYGIPPAVAVAFLRATQVAGTSRFRNASRNRPSRRGSKLPDGRGDGGRRARWDRCSAA